MRKIFFMTILIYGFTKIYGQAVDTVTTVDYGKMPPVYFSNKVYWEKNYDNKNHLLFEGLKYNSCFIGAFINYWNNGNIKTIGKYLSDATGKMSDLQSRGFCSVQTGEWKNYDETGKLTSTVLYDKGKVIKEY